MSMAAVLMKVMVFTIVDMLMGVYFSIMLMCMFMLI